jgi:hypothetical protein
MSTKPALAAPPHRHDANNAPVWAALAAIIFVAVIVAGTFPHGPW